MLKINKDEIDKFFSNNMLFDSRIIHIGSPDSTSDDGAHSITFHTASDVWKQIILLEGASTAPISINLMSYGGDVYAAMAIYDIIKACRCEITIRGAGAVMSGGSIILQAASPGKRLLYPNTEIMLHDGQDGFSGHPRDLERWAESSKKMRTKMYKIYAERCGRVSDKSHKADFWRKKLDHDWILNAEDAIKWNIADEICERNF